MRKILVLFAHPRLEKSRANKTLLAFIPRMPGISLVDLYEQYPHFDIDIDREQNTLLEHDIIVLHHPFYWYSCPPLLKQWIDMVLEFGWAYGPGGNSLKDKTLFHVITTGGGKEAYCREGRNHFTMQEFLVPFEQTARLCGMRWLPPFVVQGTHRLSDPVLEQYGHQYASLLGGLHNGHFTHDDLMGLMFLNDVFQSDPSVSTP